MEKPTKMPRLAKTMTIMYDLSKLGVLPPRRHYNGCKTCIYIGQYDLYDLYGCTMRTRGVNPKLYEIIVPYEIIAPLGSTPTSANKLEEARVEARRRINIIQSADNIEASGDALNRLRKVV